METEEPTLIPDGARHREFRELYPFEGRFLEVGGGARMHYLDEGEGEALLCLHGNPTWSFYYRNVVMKFGGSFRCVVPDHVGCGFSSKPQDYPYRLAQHIDNVEKLVAHLGLRRINLLVHDWGGAIGMGLAARRPELIDGIVILNTAAFPSRQIPWRINVCRTPLLGSILVRGLNGFAGAAVYMATARRGGLPGPVRRGYLLPYGTWHSRVALHRFVQDIPMSPGHPTYPLLKEIGEKITELRDHPALICWGGRDFCFNDHFLRRWNEKLPQARVRRFADAGHYVLEDAGDEVLAAMSEFFLTEA